MIYADSNATYPVDPAHYDDVAQILKAMDGNPSSIHKPGRTAKVALEDARTHVARLIGARTNEVIFTSGATEANNAVIQGIVNRFKRTKGETSTLPHVVVTAVEHKAVLDPIMMLVERGECKLDIAPVKNTGELDVEELLNLVKPDTALVCIMHANNEIGMIFPVAEIGKKIKEIAPNAHYHVDAVQMLGKANLTWYGKSTVDSAAFSGHKIGAFKGIGALYLRSGSKLGMFMAGGGQERGRRPGTENIPGIVSFGRRCAEIYGQEDGHADAMHAVTEAFRSRLLRIPGAIIHGHSSQMLPNTVHFHIEGIPGDDILLNLDLSDVYASSGSACSSGSARPSHVVLALGYSEWIALNSVRVSFSAKNSVDEGVAVAELIQKVVERAKKS